MRRRVMQSAAANYRRAAWKYPNPGGGTASAAQTFTGQITGQTTTFRYGVSATYNPANVTRGYPLVLFLHGAGGSENTGIVDVWPAVKAANAAYALDPANGMEDCVFATVRGLDGWYTNNAAADIGYQEPGAWPIETMIMDELIPHCGLHFNLNGIVIIIGFSMGGFGTKLGLKYMSRILAISPWGAPRLSTNLFDWSVSAPTEYVSIWDSSQPKIDANTMVQIADVNRSAIIAAAYPIYMMKSSQDLVTINSMNNAITLMSGFGISLTVADVLTTGHEPEDYANNGFPALSQWLQQKIDAA